MSKSSSRGQRTIWCRERVLALGHCAHAARAAVVLGALALAALPASAQGFIVEAGETAGAKTMNTIGDHGVIDIGGTISSSNANGAVLMNNHNQVLENAGTIATSGNVVFGIHSIGSNAIIGNSSTIATSGNVAYGIWSVGGNAIIDNSGTIATSGDDAYGIISSGGNAIIGNSGTIATSGDQADGIWSSGSNAIIGNSGTIATSGDDTYGIRSSGGNAIIGNSGTIATSGDFAHGIYSSGAKAAVTNSGTIGTSGDFGVGIYSNGATAIITNSGAITTSGSTAYGIYAIGTNATVTNSGTIIAEQANAIHFNLGDATLNLLAGSIIQGGLRFAGTGNALNFGPGLNAVLTLTGPGASGVTVTAGGNPFVVSGTKVAVLDPAGFAMTDALALGLAGDLATGATRGPQRCLPVLGSNDCATSAWLGGFGSFGNQPGSATLGGFEQQRGGGLMGLDFASGGGIFVGAVGAHGSAGSNQNAGLQGGVAGGHVRLALDDYFAEFYAALRILQIDNNRTVLNNTVVGGLEFAGASQAGSFLSPAMTLGRAFATGAGTLTPSLRLRYTGLQLSGYTETGASGLVIDSRMVHELELRAQLQLALPPAVTEGGTFSTTLRAGADLVHQRADISGQLLGQAISFAAGGGGTRIRGFAAAEFNYALTGGTALFGSIQASRDTAGSYSGTVQAGLRGAF